MSRDTIFEKMVRAALSTGGDDHAPTADAVLKKMREREQLGSTFLNEGIALPHARIEGLKEPRIAVGITHAGVLDSPAEKPIEIVFMLLSPAEGANAHLQLLAKGGRLLQSRELRRRLAKTQTLTTVIEEIREWENSSPTNV